jgi:hypothetical protein
MLIWHNPLGYYTYCTLLSHHGQCVFFLSYQYDQNIALFDHNGKRISTVSEEKTWLEFIPFIENSPINVIKLRELLQTHPDTEFVNNVCNDIRQTSMLIWHTPLGYYNYCTLLSHHGQWRCSSSPISTIRILHFSPRQVKTVLIHRNKWATISSMVNKLRELLQTHPDTEFVNNVCNDIREGVDPMITNADLLTFEYWNNLSARSQPVIVKDLIDKECEKGFLSGPYKIPPFKKYRVSPLGLAINRWIFNKWNKL